MSKGGARPGAGRPRTKAPHKAVTFSVSLLTIEQARDLRAKGVKVNRLVEQAIRDAWDDKVWEQNL